MAFLPVLSGHEVVQVFEHFGWHVARSHTHIIMTKPGHIATLAVPNHREVARGTLRSPIRSAGITVEEFIDAAKQV